MKHTVFHSVGFNKYSTITAEGEEYICTRSYVDVDNGEKINSHLQGFKLLALEVPILVLLTKLADLEKLEVQSTDVPEFGEYMEFDHDNFVKGVHAYYNAEINIIKETLFSEGQKVVENAIEDYKSQTPYWLGKILLNFIIDGNSEVLNIQKSTNTKLLYANKVSGIVHEYLLYNVDMFGTLTIYRVVVVKEHVKSIETHVFDKTIATKFLELKLGKKEKEKD